MPTKRIPYIDLAKGICILLVVLSHTINYYGINSPVNRMVAMFRMPLYYILSGLFFKTYEGLWGLAVRKINKLIVPLLFFGTVAVVVAVTLLNAEAPLSIVEAYDTAMHYNHPIWFLLCLFEINIAFFVVDRIVVSLFHNERAHRFAICGIALAVGIVGLALSQTDITLPLYLGHAMVGMPFFVFGWALRHYTDFLHQRFQPRRDYVAIALFLILVAAMTTTVKYGDNYFSRRALLTLYPAGVMGALAMFLIAKRITRIPIVSYCGHYSIIILCTHFVIIQVLKYPIMRLGWDVAPQMWLNFGVSLTISVALIPIGRHILPWFTAQRDLLPIPKH